MNINFCPNCKGKMKQEKPLVLDRFRCKICNQVFMIWDLTNMKEMVNKE